AGPRPSRPIWTPASSPGWTEPRRGVRGIAHPCACPGTDCHCNPYQHHHIGDRIMVTPSWVEIVRHNTARHGELVVGIDPNRAELPAFFDQDDGDGWIGRFTDFVLDTIEGHAGFVKFQSAYFEACGLKGLSALSQGMKRARAAGLGVILDAKR